MVVNVFLFDDFEVMDAFGPVEILGRVPEHFYVRFISLRGGLITGKQEIKYIRQLLSALHASSLFPPRIHIPIILPYFCHFPYMRFCMSYISLFR